MLLRMFGILLYVSVRTEYGIGPVLSDAHVTWLSANKYISNLTDVSSSLLQKL